MTAHDDGRARDGDTGGGSGTGAAGDGADAAATPHVGDHLRPAEATASVDTGVYRVVGTTREDVALLRVGDADGRRVHTGDVATVARGDLRDFEAAENPDGNRSAGAAVSSTLRDLGWQLRAFWAGLRARPVASLGALALAVAGHQGDRFLSGPDPAFTLAYVVGVLAVVYLGMRGG